MLNVLQKRYKFGEDFTLSHLYLNGAPFPGCLYILEDAVREIPGKQVSEWKIPKETAIPIGRYIVKKTWSGRWGKLMWEITGVPGFTGIRPHAGNYAGQETFYKEIPVDIQKGVLYSSEYVEVFDDEKER